MSEGIDCGEPSDADLARRTANGDRDAFAHIYRKYQATIFRFARLMTGCNTAAEDVVQEVFLALMRDASNYSPDRASLSTYLYGVARNQTRRRLCVSGGSSRLTDRSAAITSRRPDMMTWMPNCHDGARCSS